MFNQAGWLLVSACAMVLSLASFGGVQTNSVPAEVQALQAEYEAEPLTYPEPPFAPVSRLLDTCPDSFKLVVDSKGDKVQERKRQCCPCKRCGGTGEETAGEGR